MAKQKEVPVNHYDILSRRPMGFHLPVAEVPGDAEAVATEAAQAPADNAGDAAAAQEDAAPSKTKSK